MTCCLWIARVLESVSDEYITRSTYHAFVSQNKTRLYPVMKNKCYNVQSENQMYKMTSEERSCAMYIYRVHALPNTQLNGEVVVWQFFGGDSINVLKVHVRDLPIEVVHGSS